MFAEEELHILLGEKSEFWKLSTGLKGEDFGEMTAKDHHCWWTITAPHLTELKPIMWISDRSRSASELFKPNLIKIS